MSSPLSGPAPRVGSRMRMMAPAALLGLIAAPLMLGLTTAPAQAVGSTGLVIKEVYGGGGNSGATYTHDFVELFNPTAAAIPVDGWSLQLRSANGTGAGSVTALSGSVPAGGHYLVQEAQGSGGTTPLPTPDATGTFAMGGTGVQVWLADTTAPLTPPAGNVSGVANIVDFVGVGTTSGGAAATSFETARAATTSNTTGVSRTGGDTDNNATDFALAAPTPANSGVVEPPPVETDATIAEIQGTGSVSPLDGDVVTTRGVVTATYPTGGLNGMYIQTGGTGGGTDATPGASDGIFVFGSNALPAGIAVGDSVEVTGPVSEFAGTTEITPGVAGVTELAEPLAPVTPLTTLPGSTCTLGACPTPAELEAAREAHEGELFRPAGPVTVTNAFSLTNAANGFMEIGLALDSKPLIVPTELRDATPANNAAGHAYNAAHGIVLDDASSANYTVGAKNTPMPWITPGHAVRVGADVTFTGNVVLEFRNGTWKIQPSHQVTDTGADTVTFEQTRAGNAAPRDVGGDLKLGTFNVLNYFNTTGVDYVANVPNRTCRYFADRALDPVTVRDCDDTTTGAVNDALGPRGAAEEEDFLRQQAKIVAAINAMDADIVSLEEIENSVALGEADRDDALAALVDALNADAGAGTWAYAPSPAAADLPAVEEQDVIRTAFIYKPAAVSLVGASKVLVGSAAFGNAREPLAQAFKKAGAPDSVPFAVIVNHFKSKSSGSDDETGQGLANLDRVAQAQALSDFAAAFATERDVDAVFLTGDFNAYTHEDPIQELNADGYATLKSDTAEEWSYSFSGLSGSLDHVLANPAAQAMVTGVDLWDINAGESIAYQYARHNYNATDFFDATSPFAASDHNPELIGLDTTVEEPATRNIQVLATNDFHGRLANNSNNEAGAAVLAGAVKQLRGQNPDTVFAAAGDLIGASTFESFIANDKPTIDALNEAGLEVSAVGNHEFDQGYRDLVDRVMAEYDAEDNPQGGAAWQYIGANVKLKATGNPAVPATWIKEFGAVEVGFVGAVTEDLPSLVNPDGISELEVTDIVGATNTEADALVAAGADVVILLVHEGAPGTNCATMDDNPASAFGSIIAGVNDNVDAIVSGHTHLAYNCSFTVPGWVTEGRDVTTRPVVSAGQYGSFLNQLVFTVDTATGEVTAKTQQILNLESCSNGTACGSSGQPAWTANYPVDEATKTIVDNAVAAAVGPGNQVLGKIAGPFNRAKFANGTTENRGGESTLGNQVAEVQRWATPEVVGGAEIAFMNPGGLRGDMLGNPGVFPRDLTYRQAANVQPFANTLVNMDLTGAQIEKVLEQQWQRTASGAVPSRAFLRLGVSEGFSYTYSQSADPAIPGAKLGEVTGMWLDGVPVDPEATYSVTVNSFLAAGGDNFRELANGATKQDTGVTDLQAMVEYMAEFAATSPLPVDYAQRAVGVTGPTGSYLPGEQVSFDLFSLSMTDPADLRDSEVAVSLDGAALGTFPVSTVISASPDGSANSNDDAGTAHVTVTLPQDTTAGTHELLVTGATTGTEARVAVVVDQPTVVTAPATTMTYGVDGSVSISVAPAADGTVQLLDGDTVVGEGVVTDGAGTVLIDGVALEPDAYLFDLVFTGGPGFGDSTGTAQVKVDQAVPEVGVTVTPTLVKAKKDSVTASIDVTAAGFTPTGFVAVYVDGTLATGLELVDGKATTVLGPFDSVGTTQIKVLYFGDAHARQAESQPVSVTVVKNTKK